MTKTPTNAPHNAPAKAAAAPEGERIAKVLSRAGVASRREAERMIASGEVAVNGKVIDSPALNVGPKDRITVNGTPVAEPEPARLWLYYKPEGLVTSASDEKGRETVFDHLPEDMPRVMSVGRLDLNSEGLLLLTNDGELKRRLELPSTGWLRKYRVRIQGNPTDPDLEPLRKGIVVDGEKFQPMSVVLDRHQGANAWLTIGLREGRNREIRRAIAAIGLIVNRLIRISYGPFRLNELQPGEVEEVRPRVLRDQLGLTGEASDDFAPAKAAPKQGAKPVRARPAAKPRSYDDQDPTKRARPAPKGTAPRSDAAPRRFGTAAAKADGTAPAKPRSFGTSAAKSGPSAGSADRPKSKTGSNPASKPASKPTAQPKRDSSKPAAPFGKPRGPAPAGGKPKAPPRKPSNR